MLTLFPKTRVNAAQATATAVASPEPSSAPVAQGVDTAPASQAEAVPVVATASETTAPEAPIEILAEISLIKSLLSTEPSSVVSEPAADVAPSQADNPADVAIASAPALPSEPLDIGEWETASAEAEPVIATKPETVFEAFSSALHSHEPRAPEPTSPTIAPNAPESAPSPETPTSAPLVETPEDLLAALAIETPAESAPTPVADAAPASPVDPDLRQALVSRSEPKATKGSSFFVLPRIPEPEAMEDSAEVDAYASAAAQSHLDAIDDTFVAHAELLLRGRERGRALDIGTGPGQIVLKLGYHLSRWKFVGVDRSKEMIAKAQEALATAPELAGRVEFTVADGNKLDFPGQSFDLVMCNSVLHHLEDPQKLFSEMARLVKPGGALLLRDLVRPTRLGFGHHVRKYGKHYAGEMKRLYVASLHAAYTEEELQRLIDGSALNGRVEVFRHRSTHIGFAHSASHPAKK